MSGLIRKIMTMTVNGFDDQRGVVQFLGTTPGIDRYGDVVVPKGAEMGSYRANPVFLWAHNYAMMPIGKSLGERVSERGIEFDIQFDLEDPLGAAAYRKYKEGYLNATSIGFIPKDAEPLQKGGFKYTKWELLELSGVPVPANPEALQMALSKSADPGEFARLLAEDLSGPPEPEAEPQPQEYVVDVNPETDEPTVYGPDGKALGWVSMSEAAHRFFDVTAKAGAVLNKANKARLQHIKTLVDEVLATSDSVDEPPPEEDAPTKTAPPPDETPAVQTAGFSVPSEPADTSPAPETPPASAIEPQLLAQLVGIAVRREVDRLMGRVSIPTNRRPHE